MPIGTHVRRLSNGFASHAAGGGAASPNPNLLLWSEELQRATWTATDCTVTADQANDTQGQQTLDRLVFVELGSIGQTTSTAATAGATATATHELSASVQAYTVSGVFDGNDFTFAIELVAAAGAPQLQLAISRSGGFLRVLVRDFNSEAPTVFAGRAKLEAGASFTGYVKREGT